LYGLDVEATDSAFLADFDLTCNFRLILWDAYIARKQAEALKGESEAQQIPMEAIPEFAIESVSRPS
jgi:hypothetical protein